MSSSRKVATLCCCGLFLTALAARAGDGPQVRWGSDEFGQLGDDAGIQTTPVLVP
jgi:hypothetical protein